MKKQRCAVCSREEKRGDNYENGSWLEPNICSMQCKQEIENNKHYFKEADDKS